MPKLLPHIRIVVTACAAVALTGCPSIRMPELYHPGSAGCQRAEALQYDPYPLDDVAPPVAGARPPEYDRPMPEVKRGQLYTPKRPTLKPLAMPAWFTPPAAPVAPVIITPAPAPPGSMIVPAPY